MDLLERKKIYIRPEQQSDREEVNALLESAGRASRRFPIDLARGPNYVAELRDEGEARIVGHVDFPKIERPRKRTVHFVQTPVVAPDMRHRRVGPTLMGMGVAMTAIAALINHQDVDWIWAAPSEADAARLSEQGGVRLFLLHRLLFDDNQSARLLLCSGYPVSTLLLKPECPYVLEAVRRLAGSAHRNGYYSQIGNLEYYVRDTVAVRGGASSRLWWTALFHLLANPQAALVIRTCA